MRSQRLRRVATTFLINILQYIIMLFRSNISHFLKTSKNARRDMKNGSLGYNGSSNKGNNIGTSYLGSGSESAFKGLGLRAIIESLPLVPVSGRISRDRADDEIRIAMSVGKENEGGSQRRICQRAPPFAQIRPRTTS